MAWASLTMERCLRPLQTILYAEFGAASSEVMIHGTGVQGDRWIDLRYLRDEQAVEPCAFASMRVVTVRIRYIRRKPASPTTALVQELLDQVDRLKYTLLTHSNHASGYWLDGQIGPCEGQPDLSDIGESAEQYEGVEIMWTCKTVENIS
jgi:hypothetical protein